MNTHHLGLTADYKNYTRNPFSTIFIVEYNTP